MRLLSLDDHGELSLGTYEESKCPPYAILSHTWYADEDEVNYNDVIDGRGKNKPGRDKIMFCGDQAKKDDLKHFWVDSCCIDKTSSAELSESLNSMFRWYQRASKCYVYLSDVEMMQGDRNASNLDSWKTAFQKSRWFTRGWTLQELIAPEAVEFWSSDRYMLGTRTDLFDLIHRRTDIPLRALKGAPLASFSIDERFRWAAPRETKKAEDKAYCLLGLFDVHMSPIYGEGRDHAFERLEKAIHDKLRLSTQDHDRAHHDRNESVNEHRKSVLKSLGFQELGARQANIRNAQRDTCEWVPEHPDYAKWRCSDRGTFWIVGKPGAGKSTLMKFLESKAKKEKSGYEFVFGFFFNARGATMEKTTNGMYRALLFELLTAFPELQITLDSKRPSDDWTLYLLKSLLSSSMQKIGPLTLRLFVDALDECDEQEIQEMVEFMEEIEDNLSEGNGMLSICFASRHYPSITIRNGVRLNLDEETGHLRDLDKYIKQHLLIGEESTLVHEIHEEVRRKANGVFLWAVLVINVLNKDIRHGRMSHVKERVDEIPIGLSALFQDILRRDNEAMGEFLLCIQWILFAQQPLHLEEFYFAMESGRYRRSATEGLRLREPWDPKHVTIDQMRRFVRSSSKGLAEVTVEATYHGSRYGPTVQFIHESVRDFVIEDGRFLALFPGLDSEFRSRSHERLKESCLNYLALDESKLDKYRRLGPSALAQDYPFLFYASKNMLHHANEAADGVSQSGLFEIYPSENHLLTEMLVNREEKDNHTHSPGVTLMYLAAERNYTRLIVTAREIGYGVWQRLSKERWQYAVIVAFVNGHQDTLRILLDGSTVSSLAKLAQDPGFGRDGYVLPKNRHMDIDQGLIVWASECANWELVETLTRAQINDEILIGVDARDTECRISLAVPSNAGRLEVLEFLLSSVPWFNARLALTVAASQDQRAIVQCILDHCHQISQSDGHTPETDISNHLDHRSLALSEGELQRLFPSSRLRSVSDNSSESWEISIILALQYAILEGHTRTVALLLDSGVDINAGSQQECYALKAACRFGELKMIQLLLDRGASFDNALATAAYKGRVEVVRVLLDRGADVNAGHYVCGNALHGAIECGYVEVVRLLLDRGADIYNVGNGHKTPLARAAAQGHQQIVQLLLDRSADVNRYGGRRHGHALVSAAVRGHNTIVKLLLDHGAEINFCTGLDGSGTALLAVCRAHHGWDLKDTIQLLLDRGADIDGCFCCAASPLYLACMSAPKEIVELLLDRGADVNFQSNAGTALQAACGRIDEGLRIVRLLLSRGAVWDYSICLKIASRTGNEPVVRFILSSGARIDDLCLHEALEAASTARDARFPGWKKTYDEVIRLLTSSSAKE